MHLTGPFTGAASAMVKDPEYARLWEIIEKMNSLFQSDTLTAADVKRLTGYVTGRLDESQLLREQAKANRLQQFRGRPDLADTVFDAVIALPRASAL